MKIAIIGAGISGLVTAYLLSQDHEVTVYEAGDYIGGHTNTISFELNDQKYEIDTGFIVFNNKNYPNFVKLLDQLGAASQPTTMSFSVSCEDSGLEYNGTSINKLFAQRINLLRPSFIKMIRDILKFNKEARKFIQTEDLSITFGEFLKKENFSSQLRDDYAVPMTAAIWSGTPEQVLTTPFYFIARFFENHGMLNIDDRPQWRVIKNGSHQYVKKLVAGFKDNIHLERPVKKVVRNNDGVSISDSYGDKTTFEKVVIATHSNQALNLLDEPTPMEKEFLGAIKYQNNEAVLHWDDSLLPKTKSAWAGWNYHKLKNHRNGATVTYDMNILQGLKSKPEFCVSLNMTDRIDPQKIIKKINYSHPVFSTDAIHAQKGIDVLNGENRTYYCGAYWGSGFHEDGVNSALKVGKHFGKEL
jgi:predicted NAD/FAD-binding protein